MSRQGGDNGVGRQQNSHFFGTVHDPFVPLVSLRLMRPEIC